MELRALVSACLVTLLLPLPGTAQEGDGLKVYISADMEGVAGRYRHAQAGCV